MSVTERPSVSKSSSAPSENVLLAVIAAALLILHIAADVILINASGLSATPTQEQARASLYD